MTRALLVPLLAVAVASSVATHGLGLLLHPAAIQAEPAAQSVGPVLRAERVELVDASGTLRAVLGGDASSWGLGLLDAAGQELAILATDGSSVGLQLGSPSGPARIELQTRADQSAVLEITSQSGGSTIQLLAEADGTISWRLLDLGSPAAPSYPGQSLRAEVSPPNRRGLLHVGNVQLTAPSTGEGAVRLVGPNGSSTLGTSAWELGRFAASGGADVLEFTPEQIVIRRGGTLAPVWQAP